MTADHAAATPADTGLPRSTPEEQGVPSAALAALLERWEGVGVETHGLMVLRHGSVVAEGSWAPYRADGIALVYSVSKTFTSCAVGFAEAEGLLRLDERLVDLFPEAAEVAGPRAARLTLHDVLSMSTGHREDTLVWRESSPATFPRLFLGTEPEEAAGSWFVYHNGATLMAALAVQRRTGQGLLEYLRPRLLDPLGVGDAAWSGHDGFDLGYSGLHVGTEALARLGELLRLDGVWQGRQLLPQGWVARASSLQTDTAMHPGTVDWHQGYGYQLWRCQGDAYRADGAWGQFSVVVPEHDLVVAVTTCSTDTQALLDGLWELLLPALAPEALPPDAGARARLLARLADARLGAPRSSVEPEGEGPWEFMHEPTADHPALVLVRVRRDPTGGWVVDVEDGGTVTAACGDGSWPDPGHSPWVASGGWTAPGVFEARVAALQTPHVLALRCSDGAVTASWNGLPLEWPALATLHAPRR